MQNIILKGKKEFNESLCFKKREKLLANANWQKFYK